jgi:hypothetical protein
MKVSSARALLISLGIGLLIGVGAGSIYALVFDKVWTYGVGTMLFLTGLIVLVMGLAGALEPKEGWVTARSTQAQDRGRRALAARLTEEHPELEDASPLSLAVWAVVVGLPLIALSFLAFNLAS